MVLLPFVGFEMISSGMKFSEVVKTKVSAKHRETFHGTSELFAT